MVKSFERLTRKGKLTEVGLFREGLRESYKCIEIHDGESKEIPVTGQEAVDTS